MRRGVSAALLPLALVWCFASGVGATEAKPAATPKRGAPWRTLEAGLEVGAFAAPKPSDVGDSIIRVLRIDPAHFELRLLNASAAEPHTPMTARGWVETHGLVAAINAAMFAPGGKSVGLMRTRTHVNNAKLLEKNYNAVLAFDRLDEGAPPVQILDLRCGDFDKLRNRYGTLVQSIRTITCDGRSAWSNPKKWGTAAIGVDGKGRVLFVHCRSPYPVGDLVKMLLKLPLGLKRMMYVEGGPESGFYVKSGAFELETFGCYESGFWESDNCPNPWPVPNVVGIVRRSRHTPPRPGGTTAVRRPGGARVSYFPSKWVNTFPLQTAVVVRRSEACRCAPQLAVGVRVR